MNESLVLELVKHLVSKPQTYMRIWLPNNFCELPGTVIHLSIAIEKEENNYVCESDASHVGLMGKKLRPDRCEVVPFYHWSVHSLVTCTV